MNRGEHSLAAPHREQVELHAAHVGSAWQVEAWEAPALIPISVSISDVVSLTQITERLDELSRKLPSLRLHARLSRFALQLVRRTARAEGAAAALEELDGQAPRSFIGWAAVCGFVARAFNEAGDHEKAIQVCQRALTLMTDGDREFVTLFLIVDLELAMAMTGLGRFDEALLGIDALLDRFSGSSHPLLVGRLHEARARVAWHAGRHVDYERSKKLTEDCFRPTGTPALIARCERLADLGQAKADPYPAPMTEGQREALTQRAEAPNRV